MGVNILRCRVGFVAALLRGLNAGWAILKWFRCSLQHGGVCPGSPPFHWEQRWGQRVGDSWTNGRTGLANVPVCIQTRPQCEGKQSMTASGPPLRPSLPRHRRALIVALESRQWRRERSLLISFGFGLVAERLATRSASSEKTSSAASWLAIQTACSTARCPCQPS